MNKFSVYGMAFLTAGVMVCSGCGTKTDGGSETDSDSIVTTTDSVPEGFSFEAEDGLAGLQTAMPPVPLYVRISPEEGKVVQVVYWTELTELNEDDGPVRIEAWKVQNAFRENRKHYTKVLGMTQILGAATVLEEVKTEAGDVGMLRSPSHPMEGVKVELADYGVLGEHLSDGYCYTTLWLLADEYLENRERLTVKRVKKAMPADVVARMEKKYGVKSVRSEVTNEMGDYRTGFIQFQPKGEVELAVELLMCGDSVWVLENEGHADPEDTSVWNVDDGGEYLPNSYDGAFVGPDGIELLFTHNAPESTAMGWMTIKGEKLVEHEIAGYYNFPE